MKNYISTLHALSITGLICLGLMACKTQDQGAPPSSTSPASDSSPQVVEWRFPDQIPETPSGKVIRYGRELISDTPTYLGPNAEDPALRLAGNQLSCSNCHLGKGTRANAIGFVGISHRYPAYYAPLDKAVTLAERINACFVRSLNGKELPLEGKEMTAMLAYFNWLSEEIPVTATLAESGLPEIEPPARAADLTAGKELYTYHCAACHGDQGLGQKKDGKQAGYVFPPLWGPDSYSSGSNLARQLIATRYIKANMPLGRPVLTTGQAYDIAAYMNAQPRPALASAGKDYPNPATKPVDVPYPPYSDQAPLEQHKLGPFGPLLELYPTASDAP